MKTTSRLILIGSVLFLTASFSPISRVHMEPTAAGKLAIITAEPTAWLLAQLLYALGALIAAAGFGKAVFQLRQMGPPPLFSGVILLLAAGSILFSVYVFTRATNPQAWVHITPPHPLFLGYTILTQIGLLLFGIMLLKTGFLRWLGWLVTGSIFILLILTAVFADMPPFVYYLLGLPVGIVFLRSSRQSSLAST
jgi:hypothetical protein